MRQLRHVQKSEVYRYSYRRRLERAEQLKALSQRHRTMRPLSSSVPLKKGLTLQHVRPKTPAARIFLNLCSYSSSCCRRRLRNHIDMLSGLPEVGHSQSSPPIVIEVALCISSARSSNSQGDPRLSPYRPGKTARRLRDRAYHIITGELC